MLVSYNFYNSILVKRLINQFVKRGQKQKIELVIFRFLQRFNRLQNFPAFWIMLSVIELHRPLLALQTIRTKNKIVHKPQTVVKPSVLMNIGLRWVKVGVVGDVSHIKKKRQQKILRRQAKELQAKVKTRGLILNAEEQAIIQKSRFSEAKRKIRPFEPAFYEYMMLCITSFEKSFGHKQLLEHNRHAISSHLYHSYKW